MTNPDPTREIPKVYRPSHPKTDQAPFLRPVPGAPRSVRESHDDVFRLPDQPYPDPRSKNPLHRYGPAVFVTAAFILLLAAVVVAISLLVR